MKKHIIDQLHSFGYAFKGLASVFVTEAHMRFHIVAALYTTVFAAMFYEFTSAQWGVLILTIAAVLFTEIINTAIERLCDTVTTEYNENIGFIKDVSAGAVLISAVAAVAVAFALFFRPSIFRYILYYFTHNIFALIVLIVITALAVLFIGGSFTGKESKSDSDNEAESAQPDTTQEE